jgi:outer membrane protein TolC
MTPYNPQMWTQDVMNNQQGMGNFMISAEQMFTNPAKLKANSDYMSNMSGAEFEMKNFARYELFSMAKMSYYEWVILKKKIRVINESESLLNYLIKSTELRYTYGMDKLNAYYKAKGMLGDIQLMEIMIDQEISQKRNELNTLLNRSVNTLFEVDSTYSIESYEKIMIDTSIISNNRSDYKVISKNIEVLRSKQIFEYSKRLPDFGIKFDHMVPFGTDPQQFSLMAMVSIPIVPWSSKMYKSSVLGLNFEIDALKAQQQILLNEVSGNMQNLKIMLQSKKQQLELYENNIMPAMKKNYELSLLAYEQNTEELFMVLDAWQNYKLIQLSYYDQLMELLALQIEYEKQLQLPLN